eukprot:RCo036895
MSVPFCNVYDNFCAIFIEHESPVAGKGYLGLSRGTRVRGDFIPQSLLHPVTASPLPTPSRASKGRKVWEFQKARLARYVTCSPFGYVTCSPFVSRRFCL